MSTNKRDNRSDYQKLADEIYAKRKGYINIREKEEAKKGENDAEFWQEEIDSMEDLAEKVKSLEEQHNDEIQSLEERITELEPFESYALSVTTMQDEIKSEIAKRIFANASIEQLEYFELQLAKKKGADYKTGNDPIKPEVQAAILARH